MKKFMCRLVVLAVMVLAMCAEAFADVEINEANFPDANFRSYVSSNFDTDSNGSLSNVEIATVTQIDVSYKAISSLKGIKFFIGLQKLNCIANPLGILDVSGCSTLTDIKCYYAQLTSIDISGCTALETLACDNNQLTLLNVSNNTTLKDLWCYNNKLTSLNVSGCSALDILNCEQNQLTALDVSDCSALRTLDCDDNSLKVLNVSGCSALETLDCESNNFTTLDLSNCTSLTGLYCDFTIESSDNHCVFNIADFMKAYKSLDDGLLYVDFRYYYGDEYGSVTLDPDLIATNNVVSFTIPEGKTFSNIYMTLTYSGSSNKNVRVYPFSGSSSGTTNTAPIITTTNLPDGTEGSSYSATLSAIGSTPITWTLLSGSLPTGLTLSSSGSISGTPTQPGAFTFTVQASNSAGSASKLFSIIVPFSEVRPPKITTSSLTDGYTDSPYGFRLQATGTSTGLTSITWSADNLPEGLSLSTSGYLSGTPTTTGTYSFTVQASNSQGSDSADLTLNISAPASNTKPSITTQTANPAATGQPYTCQLMASGTPPFSWTLSKGKLPPGLSITSSGLITGSPTKKGKKNFTVIASNDYGADKKKISITVYDMPSITTTSLKDATVAKKYTASIKKKGSKPLTWELEGSLPQGLTFNDSKAKISGTPTVNDKGMIRLTLSNPAGELSKVYTLAVKAISPTIKPASLKAGTFGKEYNASLKVKGTAPITLLLSGDLPEGLSFDNGKITGTPQEVCTNRPLTVYAVNMGGVTAQNYSLTVKAVAPKITTKKLPDAVQGSEYSFDVEATGTPPITWKASGLPQGLSMTTNGNISGTPSKSGKFRVKVTAENSSKTAKKSYKLTVTAAADKNNAGIQETAENSHNTPGVMKQKVSHDGLRLNNEAASNISITNGGNDVLSEEYVIIAELGTISVDKAGMYDFSVTLSDDVPAGKELVYLAGSSEPSADDVIAEFYDESGKETDRVPESRTLTVSVWLDKDRTYTPSLAVRH